MGLDKICNFLKEKRHERKRKKILRIIENILPKMESKTRGWQLMIIRNSGLRPLTPTEIKEVEKYREYLEESRPIASELLDLLGIDFDQAFEKCIGVKVGSEQVSRERETPRYWEFRPYDDEENRLGSIISDVRFGYMLDDIVGLEREDKRKVLRQQLDKICEKYYGKNG